MKQQNVQWNAFSQQKWLPSLNQRFHVIMELKEVLIQISSDDWDVFVKNITFSKKSYCSKPNIHGLDETSHILVMSWKKEKQNNSKYCKAKVCYSWFISINCNVQCVTVFIIINKLNELSALNSAMATGNWQKLSNYEWNSRNSFSWASKIKRCYIHSAGIRQLIKYSIHCSIVCMKYEYCILYVRCVHLGNCCFRCHVHNLLDNNIFILCHVPFLILLFNFLSIGFFSFGLTLVWRIIPNHFKWMNAMWKESKHE